MQLSILMKFYRTLTGNKKSKKFFGEHTEIFSIRINPQNYFQLVNMVKNKRVFFAKRNFSFFALFSNSTQSEFGCDKNESKHYTPPIMVLLGFFAPTVPILIPKLGQNTTKERQDLLFLNISVFTPQVWNYFCIFLVLRVVNGFFSTPEL